MAQLSFQGILEKAVNHQQNKTGQRKVAEVIASLLLFSFELEEKAQSLKGPDSAQRRLTQLQTAKEIRARISKLATI